MQGNVQWDFYFFEKKKGFIYRSVNSPEMKETGREKTYKQWGLLVMS